MLMHAIHTAQKSGDHSTIIVLGAEEERLRKEIGQLNAEVVSNPLWKTGMGSSIRTGLHHTLEKFPAIASVIIMVCDQPLLTPGHLKKIIAKYEETHKPIIASQYAGIAGVPALFDKAMFREIAALPDDQGAKKIIQEHFSETALVDFEEGAIDLDTLEDYRRFIM